MPEQVKNLSIFDEPVDRRHTDCVKWDMVARKYGNDHLIPLWIADMDFRLPKETRAALQKCVDFGVFGYTECPDRVYHAITSWLSERYRWTISKEQLIMNHNVVSSISLALRALTKPGDKVLISRPVYNPFFEQINQLQRIPVYSDLCLADGRYTLDLADMETKIKSENVRCLLICSPHNPGGIEWQREELEGVLRLSNSYNLPIIADEIHADLMLYGNTHTPLAQLNEAVRDRIVTLMSPTKTFNLAGIGPSYMIVFNEELRQRITKEQQLMVYPSINRFQIEALCASYYIGRNWLNELIPYIEKNIQLVKDKLACLPELSVMKQDACYLVWIDYRALAVDEQEAEQAFIKAGVLPQMGSIYGANGAGFIRVNVASSWAIVAEGMNRIVSAFQSLKRTDSL
ncbi:MAG: MalY/PatB family protein [Sporolactobacillus sp.]